MKVKVKGLQRVYIIGEYIKLDALLKYCSLVSTGGEAKTLIQNGEVLLGKKICTQRGKKIKPGDAIRYGKNIILVKRTKE